MIGLSNLKPKFLSERETKERKNARRSLKLLLAMLTASVCTATLLSLLDLGIQRALASSIGAAHRVRGCQIHVRFMIRPLYCSSNRNTTVVEVLDSEEDFQPKYLLLIM